MWLPRREGETGSWWRETLIKDKSVIGIFVYSTEGFCEPLMLLAVSPQTLYQLSINTDFYCSTPKHTTSVKIKSTSTAAGDQWLRTWLIHFSQLELPDPTLALLTIKGVFVLIGCSAQNFFRRSVKVIYYLIWLWFTSVRKSNKNAR